MSASQFDRRHPYASFGFLAAWVALSSCDASARHEVAADTPQPARGSADTQKADAEQFVGTYAHVGGQAERDAVLAAIEGVVADMNIIARSIARDRLQASNPVPKKLAITRDGETLTVAFDEREYAAPLDGSSVEVVGVTGDRLEYRVTVDGEQLRQSFVGSKGQRNNTMTRRDDKLLLVEVEVSSGSLPKPLEYSLTLERRG